MADHGTDTSKWALAIHRVTETSAEIWVGTLFPTLTKPKKARVRLDLPDGSVRTKNIKSSDWKRPFRNMNQRFYAVVTFKNLSPGRHYFDLGGTILAVYDPEADGDPAAEWKHHPNQYIYIGVDDVDAAFGRVAELGGTLISDRVETMPWGERLFYARDPSGNPISIVDAETLFLGT